MHIHRLPTQIIGLLSVVWVLSGCAAPDLATTAAAPVLRNAAGDGYLWLNRLSWGASPSFVDAHAAKGFDAYLTQQLRPAPAKPAPCFCAGFVRPDIRRRQRRTGTR